MTSVLRFLSSQSTAVLSQLCPQGARSLFTFSRTSPLVNTLVPIRASHLRKRKRVDPKIEQAREARLKKRIKRLLKKDKEMVAVEDFFVMPSLLEQVRERPPVSVSFEEQERRAALEKEWSRFRRQQYLAEEAAMSAMVTSQQRALQELRAESEELFQQAVQVDPLLIPYQRLGPTETPPISAYDPPDGKYVDLTPME
ncbi:large ribosomal subunit protein mL40-like [Branchiostoma lanceolatum]|uniref:large ribosomal subunit protein mL40-like n=1 Tax=Branchiostoma lanceolatum TaxID=7740 RepID=UPI003456670B